MVTTLIAATGLMFCQETVTFENSVVHIQPGPEWIVGDSTFCTSRTVLSPDGSKKVELPPPVPSRSDSVAEGGVTETTLVPPKPPESQPLYQCKPTYRVHTIDIEFLKDKAELSPEMRGRLTALMAESPVGLSIGRERFEKAEARNSAEMARARIEGLRGFVEKLAVTMPSMTIDDRVVAKPASTKEKHVMYVTAVFSNPCGERVMTKAGVRAARAPQPTSTALGESKGGMGVAK